MSRPIKQKPEAKKILKQKLINYQNELKQQADIVIYDGYHTAGSQKFGLMTLSKKSLEISPSKQKRYPPGDYQRYLNEQMHEDDFSMGKKSLTRENILAINKKSKIIKSNLNQLAKQRRPIETAFVPYASLECTPSVTPQNLENPLSPQFGSYEIKDLRSLLTIKPSRKQQTDSGFDKLRQSMSQQSTRKRPHSTINIKPVSAKNQTRSNIRTFSALNPQKSDPQLTEYYTPCYHKETRTGYIVSDFQPKIRSKHFEDNLKMMAKMIKKKISYLERDQIVDYLKTIGEKKVSKTQDGKIQELVRKNNWLSERNIMESKMVKAGKVQEPKRYTKKTSKAKH